jgi:glycosyltransferase 2 family protein
MKQLVSLFVRFGLAGACLIYAAWGVDFHRLLEVVASFRPWTVALYVAAVLIFLLPGAFRLRFLVGDRITARQGLAANLIGLALNNLLPARLGEMAKALYLSRKGDLSLGRSLEAVFWERFFDLNALLLLGAAVALLLGEGLVLYPLLAGVGGIWCFLLLLRLRPTLVHNLLGLLPGQKLRLFLSEMLSLLHSSLRLGFLGRLSLWTLAAWAGYGVTYSVGLCLMAGLPADPILVLTFFAVVTLGFALPAAPGGMGVFEAAAVVALGWFGVDKDRAFAVGLALHLLQYLPVTVLGLVALAGSGLSLQELRRRSGAVTEAG